MAFTPIPIGSLAWGTPVNNALASQDARIAAVEAQGGATLDAQGIVAAPFDPAAAASGTAFTSGTVYMTRVDIVNPATLAGLVFTISTAGAGLTAGQNLAGLYDASGNRVALSADQSAAWTAQGIATPMFTAPYAAAPGAYFLALLSVGTTPISLLRAASSGAASGVLNFGLGAAGARFATGPTGQTTLPVSVTMASRTGTGTAFWVGAV